MIRIYWGYGEIEVQEHESSYRYRAIMAKPSIILKFSLAEYVEIPVGARCDYQNETYTLLSPANLKKNGERSIEYTLTMGTDAEHLSRYKLRNNEDGRLKWSMTAKPAEFVRQIVLNLNKRDGEGVWSVGTCLDAPERTIEFNHSYLLDALASVAEEFETEWEIDGHTISLHKVEYFKDSPLPLSYGKGNGFVPAVGRSSSSDAPPIEILYVQGGDKNIDRSKYGSQYLLLPSGQTYEYEGRVYKVSADGLSIKRANLIPKYNNEDSIELQDIYPSRVGKVSEVFVESIDKHFYDVIDSSIPENLNYNNYLIDGETMTIIFQSGMLAGREFEVKYNHAERRFKIVPQEFDGVTMPSETFKPTAGEFGDTYAIFGIMLPQEYIRDDENQNGASWDMFKEACRYLYENESQKFTFTGELQGIWAKRNWLEVGGRLKVGGYVHFSDHQFAPDGTDIRIVGIKDFLHNPYAPTIELSNEAAGSSLTSTLREVEKQEVVIEKNKKNALQFTKRRFRDAQETIDMLEGAISNYSSSINPASIQTMAMLVGDESLQFVFLDESGSEVSFMPTYNAEEKTLACPISTIKHMTLGIKSISASHNESEYNIWRMDEYVSPVLMDGSAKYYLYARCPHDTTQKGQYLLSTEPIKIEEVVGYYHLLVGILNSEYEGERSFVTLHGYTEILPARITTNNIVSSDGLSFFDLLNGSFHVGNDETYIDYNNVKKGSLNLKNANISLFNKNGTQTLDFNAEDGSGFLSCGKLSWTKDGDLIMEGFVKPSVLYITEENYEDYIYEKIEEVDGFTIINKTIDFTRTGGLVHVLYWPQDSSSDNIYVSNIFFFPSLYANVDYTNEEKDYVRQFVGQRLMIYNHLDIIIPLSGNLGTNGDDYGVSLALYPNEVGIFRCNIYKVRKDILDGNSEEVEAIGWQVERIKFIK